MPTPSTPQTTSRMPNPMRFVPDIATAAQALHKVVDGGVLPDATVKLMRLRVGQLLGSEYFTVRDTADLAKSGETPERIEAVANWTDATCFTDAERVALKLVDAVHTPNPTGERVSDELYAEASAHYDDEAMWALVLVIGHMGFFAPAALIAKPIPGMPPGQNYRD
ncbi:MAG TPA: carboxymuconolactone decarboxylase family protein [Phytomonospora sp.]